jgi:hypothetical protein
MQSGGRDYAYDYIAHRLVKRVMTGRMMWRENLSPRPLKLYGVLFNW